MTILLAQICIYMTIPEAVRECLNSILRDDIRHGPWDRISAEYTCGVDDSSFGFFNKWQKRDCYIDQASQVYSQHLEKTKQTK